MEFELNTFHNLDCNEAMKKIPDQYFDLAIVDPPYGISVCQMNMGGRQTIRPDGRGWDNKTPSPEYFSELMRISKNQVIWGGNYFDLPPSRCFLIWDKGESMYGRSFSECEYAWTSFDKSSRMFKLSPNDKARIHPTQKPVALYAWILSLFAQKGDSIIDTHVGSGSSLIACHDMECKYLGFEIDTDYYDSANKRLADHKSQISIMDCLTSNDGPEQTFLGGL